MSPKKRVKERISPPTSAPVPEPPSAESLAVTPVAGAPVPPRPSAETFDDEEFITMLALMGYFD